MKKKHPKRKAKHLTISLVVVEEVHEVEDHENKKISNLCLLYLTIQSLAKLLRPITKFPFHLKINLQLSKEEEEGLLKSTLQKTVIRELALIIQKQLSPKLWSLISTQSRTPTQARTSISIYRLTIFPTMVIIKVSVISLTYKSSEHRHQNFVW